MASWKDQINRHTVVLPSGITKAMNGRIPAHLLVDVHDGNGRRIGRLNITAARSWKAMVAHAKRDGVILDATDTYRTIESQRRLWDTRYDHTDHGNGGRTCGGEHRFLKDGEATAACPGTSKHGYAQAVDDDVDDAGHRWLEQHAGTYGWEWELASEKWHLHYWPGDSIPQAVLDFEANTSEEDDMTKDQEAALNGVLAAVIEIRGNVRKLAEHTGAPIDDDVDEEAIVKGVLAGLTPEAIAAAIPAELAEQVANVIAERLKD